MRIELQELLDLIDAHFMVDDGSAILHEQQITVQKELKDLHYMFQVGLDQKEKMGLGVQVNKNPGFLYGQLIERGISWLYVVCLWMECGSMSRVQLKNKFDCIIRLFFPNREEHDLRLKQAISLLYWTLKSSLFKFHFPR